jgi:uroporphyrinogen-III synthase
MSANKMIVVTRPRAQAASWIEPLQAAGWDARALPLLQILPAPEPDVVLQAWQNLGYWDAVMFVSSNAVQHFFAARPVHGGELPTSGRPRWWVTGPGSLQVLLQYSGIQYGEVDCPAEDSEQWDSEALWQQVQSQLKPGYQVLIVRGAGGGRDWLQQRLTASGAIVTVLAAYQRIGSLWEAAQRITLEQAVQCGAVWLFSSTEALHHLCRSFPAQSWRACYALATHPRIGQVAAEAGFGKVLVSRPDLTDVLACLETVP